MAVYVSDHRRDQFTAVIKRILYDRKAFKLSSKLYIIRYCLFLSSLFGTGFRQEVFFLVNSIFSFEKVHMVI